MTNFISYFSEDDLSLSVEGISDGVKLELS